jgi:prepilin-type N-terminal cleavage/methylation domain-containing protein
MCREGIVIKPQRSNRRKGFTLIEMLIVVAIVLIIAAVALPRLDKARMQTYETACIQEIKTLHTAQAQYLSQFGRFATKLEELGPPTGGQTGPAAADLVQGDLAKGQKSGYNFTLTGGPAGYTIVAVPTVFNSTGRRTFFSDQTLVIRQNWGAEPATAQSGEIK